MDIKSLKPRHEKPDFCICENKGADQLRGNHAVDQRLYFRYIDTISLFFLNQKYQTSSHLLRVYSPVCFGPDRKPGKQVFTLYGSFRYTYILFVHQNHHLRPHVHLKHFNTNFVK